MPYVVTIESDPTKVNQLEADKQDISKHIQVKQNAMDILNLKTKNESMTEISEGEATKKAVNRPKTKDPQTLKIK
jgi:hypothetical protein